MSAATLGAFWPPVRHAVPPNLFGVAAFAMLAPFSTRLLAHRRGLEVAYLLALSRHPRFSRRGRGGGGGGPAGQRDPRHQRSGPPGRVDQEAQDALEARCDECSPRWARRRPRRTRRLARLAWMHLKLLAARQALERVMASGAAEAASLETQGRRWPGGCSRRLPDELKRTLEQQAGVIQARRDGHIEAARGASGCRPSWSGSASRWRWCEQVLLSTGEPGHSSVDSLSASLDEASAGSSTSRSCSAASTTDAPHPARCSPLAPGAPPRENRHDLTPFRTPRGAAAAPSSPSCWRSP